MTWPSLSHILLWVASIVAAGLLALYLLVYEAFQPGTPLSRLQRRIEMARITTVLDRPQVINGFPLPAGTEVVWEDPSHRRPQAATLRTPTEILGVRATGLLRVVEGGWVVGLADAQEIDGWTCAKGEVELTTAGRLRNCELSGTPTWRGWRLPPHTSVQPRPELHQVWLQLDFAFPLDKPLESPVVGRMPWIIAFNEDGSPLESTYDREAPYRVAGQELSGDVRWDYDPATYGMGRERPPVAVSGFVHEGRTRRHVVLPWPGSATPEREGRP
ncbi:hypothetical protein [Roseomonas populi]|uniref:Uncharacterized protein n=1 Tax=Roseomonas populi TaxID=3121582 RepID=A0ABT1X4T0_9PROT|nr:hypothetical protein [Roseomonas pecuniae]MCR0983113.1 hypothetical protein [Roseomonas pecuniae]